jgi:hypothetical protein
MGTRKSELRILPRKESATLREAYLQAFVDRSSAHYQTYIEARFQFTDGAHYTGYLWDCIRGGIRITYERFCHEVVRHREVHVMADDHSRDRVISDPLWPYAPNSVAILQPNLLLQLLQALPKDIYVFDESMSWTLILTHEHDERRRICLGVGIDPEKS